MNAPRLTLHWKWFAGVSLFLILLLAGIHLALKFTLPAYLIRQIRADLERHAHLVAAAATTTPAGQLNAALPRWAGPTGLRITLLTTNGTVIAQSDKPLDQFENHGDRPEIQAARQHGTGSATRRNATLDVDLLYVALRTPTGYVCVAAPLEAVGQTIAQIQHTITVASLVLAGLALPVVFWLARRVSAPLEAMHHMATRVAAGDFSHRAPTTATGEVGALARSLNEMSRQLETRLRELTNEKAHLAGILAGMTEGVLVVDAAGKIRLMNAALRMAFGLTDDALGKTTLEVFRHAGLAELLAQPGARELTFAQPVERTFAVQAGPLAGQAGAVVVFHDITRLRQLENVRRDFVANVSHELRTPLSIIKGYIETLLEEPAPAAAVARQFLETIQRHSRRLENLVEDLLSISALESQQARLDFAPVNLHATATAVIEELADRAAARSVTIHLEIPPAFPAVRADAQRVHQVLVNLLDNAIKYTPTGSHVRVRAAADNGTVTVTVADNGPGIAPEHLPRIFERFYRVDKARSRELGGTGLGLAIVKHIVQAHGGRVWVESDSTHGSRFHFTLLKA